MAEPGARFALALYRGAGRVLSPFAGAFIRIRARRGKEDMSRRHERYGEASQHRPDGSLVWIHAASVGETLAVLPLINRIESSGPHVLLTTGTVTSARLAATRIGARTIHHFVPIDMLPFVKRFLDHWQPDLAIFVESELWPAKLHELRKRHIPHVLVNARMSERSFRRWHRFQGIVSGLLESVDLCLAQTVDDGERFRALGAPRVTVTGNLKFDTPAPLADEGMLANLVAHIGKRPVWLAASTHHGEEEAVIRVHRALLKYLPNLLTIIAPRHPQRGGDVVAIAHKFGLSTSLRSLGEPLDATAQVYVADTIGELGLFYRAVPATFIGGSLIEHGGQNPIEAARLDTAIVHGPHIGNFSEIYNALDSAGAAVQITTTEALARTIGTLLLKPERAEQSARSAGRALREFEGALNASYDALGPLLHTLAVSSELRGVRS